MPNAVLEEDEEDMLKSAADFNESFMQQVEEVPRDGGKMIKGAAAGAKTLKRHLRENGIARNILPPEEVTDADLSPSTEHDLPRIIREMEAAQITPRIVPLGTPPETAQYRGNKYEIMFFTIQTPEFIQTVDRLRTYKTDLREVLTDNMLRDIQTIEDEFFFGEVDEAVGTTSGVGLAGMSQHQLINGAITSQTYPSIKAAFMNRRLPLGVFVMSSVTTLAFETFLADDIGFDLREKFFRDGIKGLGEFTIAGVKHLATIKNDIVANNSVYQFTEPGRLGNFCILQDVHVYLERKRDWIRTSAEEKIGVTLANTAGMNLVDFES